METFTSVRPEHLNQHGFLFGGQMLLWVDEFAALAAIRDYPTCKFVTVGIDKADFKKPAPSGSILRFTMIQTKRGATSLTYDVHVYATPPGATVEYEIFSTTVVFVRVDDEGKKLNLPCSEC